MTVQALPWSIQGQSHPAENARNVTAGMLGAPVAAFTNAVAATTAGGSHGVTGSTDLAVTQNGTPNMSVNVAAGRAFIRSGNASSIAAATYAAMNDATVNVAISAADPTNPRIDLVVIQVRDTNYGEAASDARLTVVTGTPAASPAVPALTSFPNSLVLAQVAVAAAVTTITNANITDKRTRAHALGGFAVEPTAQVPTGVSLQVGQPLFNTTTKKASIYDDTAAAFVPLQAAEMGYAQITTGSATFTTVADITGLSVTWTAYSNRIYELEFVGNVTSSVAADEAFMTITDAANAAIAGTFSDMPGVAGRRYPCVVKARLTGVSGSVTYKVRGSRNTGTGNLQVIAAAGRPAIFWVKDIGPA